MINLIVFAVVGLLTGAAARLFYPGRQPSDIFGTLGLGVIGGILGGLISFGQWPEVDSQFQSGNLLVSAIGSLVAIAAGAAVAYVRGMGGNRNPAL